MPESRPALLVPRLALLMFVGYGIMGAWAPIFSLYLEKTLAFSPLAIGWACATNAVGALLAPLVWGQIADRWLATERCISVCALGTLGLLLALTQVDEPVAVFAVCVAFWFFMVPVLSLAVALTFRQLPHPERDFSKVRVWGTIGWVVANFILSLWLAYGRAYCFGESAVDLTDSIRLGAIYALITAVYALTLPHTPPAPSQAPLETRAAGLLRLFDAPLLAFRLLRDPNFMLYAVCLFGSYVTLTFTSQMNPLLLQKHGVTPAQVPLALTLSQSSEIVAIALMPLLLDRLGLKGTMALGLSSWALGLLALTWGDPVWLVLLAFVTHGTYICCFVVVGQVFVNREAGPDFRASAQGLLQLISGLGLLAGHVLVGWIRQQTSDFTQAYAPAAVTAVALAVLFSARFKAKRG